MIILNDTKHRYLSIFNPETGEGIRSNIIDENGEDTGVDPFMGSFPELLDVGIMGSCAHGQSGLCIKSGVQCYQSGTEIYEDNMPLENFKKIVDECKGRTFQIALGGRGDPDMHQDFEEILIYCRESGVVPNFTTSGFGLTKEKLPAIKKYCGAAAVSWYRNEYTTNALDMLINYGIRTNIHYCLSNQTIDEAIEMIRNKKYPKNLNRVIFLLHKPIGLGKQDQVLNINDKRVEEFFSLFNTEENVSKAGFDSCSVPALIHLAPKIHPMCIEPCEAGRFSAYISPDYKLYPCSFEKDETFGISIYDNTIEEAFNSEIFDSFRNRQIGKCEKCPKKASCLGGCPVVSEITLCESIYRINN